MKKKEYEVSPKKSRSMKFLQWLFHTVKKHPKIINDNKELVEPAMYVSNHASANGPITYESFFPVRLVPLGAHEMCGNYKTRWKYLYYVFYQQKLKWNKFKAWNIATIFAVISRWVYTSINLIPTYTDTRLIHTFRCTHKVYDINLSTIIFPEDSTDGYELVPTKLNAGYIAILKSYFKKKKIDLPLYTCHFNPKKNKIVITEPIYVNKLLSEGKTENEINNIIVEKMNYANEKMD